MIRFLTLLLFLSGLSYGADPEAKSQVAPVISLFVVHAKMPEGGLQVTTPSKSSKGFVAARPELELPSFLDVVHLAPKVLKRTPDGKMVFVDGEADLLLNLHKREFKKLEALHKNVGEARLYVRVTVGKTVLYFDAEFAPVSDDTIFVEGTADEKRKLANLLRNLITEKPKGEQGGAGQPATAP